MCSKGGGTLGPTASQFFSSLTPRGAALLFPRFSRAREGEDPSLHPACVLHLVGKGTQALLGSHRGPQRRVSTPASAPPGPYTKSRFLDTPPQDSRVGL